MKKRNFGHEDASAAPVETLGSIVKTHDIDQFLSTNERRYIVGSKGSGKTLLLLRKAIDQRRAGTGMCIPRIAGNPVDRLVASRHVGAKFNKRFEDRKEASLGWSTVWKRAILSSVLHHARDELVERHGSALDAQAGWQRELLEGRIAEARGFIESIIPKRAFSPYTPFDYFTSLANRLDSARQADVQGLTEEVLDLHLLLGEHLRFPVFVFLDNLDDYYESEPDLWTNSMYGQLRAIREIGLRNSNIHVFTSIRQDVFEQFDDEMSLQYFSYVAFLKYGKNQLLQIFESNVGDLQDDLLAEPEARKSDLWRAFFGELRFVAKDGAGNGERIQDYLVRHTLGRPRDIIHVGNALLGIRPVSGPLTEEAFRQAVDSAQSDIARQYLQEIRPSLDDRFDVLAFVRMLPGDAIPSTQVRSIAERFAGAFSESENNALEDSDLSMPFETLYCLGLLGAPKKVGQRNPLLVQAFQPVGYGLPHRAKRVLPAAEWYLLHPVLHPWLAPTAKRYRLVIGNELPFDQGALE